MSNDVIPAAIYQSLTTEQANVAVRAEERIKTREVLRVIENGLDLIEVKKSLGHGHFTPWVEQAFFGTITIRSAQRWMNAAEQYGGKNEVTSLLKSEVLLLLSAPSMPDEVREEIEARALAGEKITVAEVQELKREAARAREETVPCWVREMNDEDAYMALALHNAQSELHPLEVGLHALNSGLSVREYAERLGHKDHTKTARMRQAAEVRCHVATDIDPAYWRCLAEIHAAPKWLWGALAGEMSEREWTVEQTRAAVTDIGHDIA
jgi:hypothetical protein